MCRLGRAAVSSCQQRDLQPSRGRHGRRGARPSGAARGTIACPKPATEQSVSALAAQAVLADLGRARRLAVAPAPTDGLAGLVRRITVAIRRPGPVLALRLAHREERHMNALLTKVAPSITDMIRADHTRVLATFHRYKAGTSAATKQALVATIALALEVHAQAEE